MKDRGWLGSDQLCAKGYTWAARIRPSRTSTRSSTRAIWSNCGATCYFVGRRDEIINVGGRKVHPEEVEAVINRHPNVQISLVKARRNPITGAVVVAHIVVRGGPRTVGASTEIEPLKGEILEACRRALAPHKVPASIRFLPSLDVTASGKLAHLGS
jgi:acyl-coenzyme A synthetase/AMP-(fatty) acid ligase